MGNKMFAAVGKVRGKDRTIMLSVGGANLDLDGIRRHFGRHPLPVKFDAPPTFVQLGKESNIPLAQAIKSPKKFAAFIKDAKDAAVADGVLAPGTAATDAEIEAAAEKGLDEVHIHTPQGMVSAPVPAFSGEKQVEVEGTVTGTANPTAMGETKVSDKTAKEGKTTTKS